MSERHSFDKGPPVASAGNTVDAPVVASTQLETTPVATTQSSREMTHLQEAVNLAELYWTIRDEGERLRIISRLNDKKNYITGEVSDGVIGKIRAVFEDHEDVLADRRRTIADTKTAKQSAETQERLHDAPVTYTVDGNEPVFGSPFKVYGKER